MPPGPSLGPITPIRRRLSDSLGGRVNEPPDRPADPPQCAGSTAPTGAFCVAIVTDSEIEALADEAEAGHNVDRLVARRNKQGRPTLGAGPASVESVRLDPELKDQLLLRAGQDHTSPSDVIREALRRDLQPS